MFVRYYLGTRMSHNDIVTQVTQDGNGGMFMPAGGDEYSDDYNIEIKMNMRGHMFTITRDDLMALPESILLCLFPNGIFIGMDGQVINNLTEDDIVYVNFPPECFQYICNIFDKAVKDLHLINELEYHNGGGVNNTNFDINDPNILNDRPSIIVLREDLDYYVIPPIAKMNVEQMRHLKLIIGEKLLEFNKIFQGLGYVSGKQLKPAEQHLMDMLCSSGFQNDEIWGHRSLEPGKTVIFSLSLARLNNNHHSNNQNHNSNSNINSPTDSPNLKPVTSSTSLVEERGRHKEKDSKEKEKRKSRLSTLAQSISRAGSKVRSGSSKPNNNNTKLLLFWRKPARKCWWSNTTVEVDISELGLVDSNGNAITGVKVNIRRVWTLELSIIGIQ